MTNKFYCAALIACTFASLSCIDINYPLTTEETFARAVVAQDSLPDEGVYHEYLVLARDTDIKMKKIKEYNYAYVDTRTALKGKLLIFFGGTSTFPRNYQLFPQMAASMGYHVINLNYINSVTVRALKNDIDTTCFTNYREEIIYGNSLSSYVTVDPANSIMNRIIKLLQYLHTHYPNDGWDQYFTDSELNFSKFVLAGHSQGGGHAAYLAYKYEVARVIVFSSPNDYSEFYRKSANWCTKPFATPIDRFYSLIHKKDEIVPTWEQYAILKDMKLLDTADTSSAEKPTFRNFRALYITYPANAAAGRYKAKHNIPVMDVSLPVGSGAEQIKSVWHYFLED